MDLRIVEICTEIWSEVSARKIVMASRKWGLESDRVEIDARVFKHWRLQSVLRAARFLKKYQNVMEKNHNISTCLCFLCIKEQLILEISFHVSNNYNFSQSVSNEVANIRCRQNS